MGQSVIGTDLTILGEKITIISQNKLQIDGDVRGDVNGKEVVIGEDGSVIGTVCAEVIEVRGGVRGAIKAKNVMLQPTSEVEGDIFPQTLSISEGAQFDGRVRRATDAAEIAPNREVTPHAAPPQQRGGGKGGAAPPPPPGGGGGRFRGGEGRGGEGAPHAIPLKSERL